MRLALLPLLQQLGAELASLLLELLPDLVQLSGTAGKGNRTESEAWPTGRHPRDGPTQIPK